MRPPLIVNLNLNLKLTPKSVQRVIGLLLLGLLLDLPAQNAMAAAPEKNESQHRSTAQSVDSASRPEYIAVLPRVMRSSTRRVAIPAKLLPLSPDQQSDLMKEILLIFAYEHDPLLRMLVRRKAKSQAILIVGGVGAFSVAMSQHMYVASQLWGPNPTAKTRHQALIRLRTPVILSFIYDGIDILTALTAATWLGIYNKKISNRKKVLDAQVDEVYAKLTMGVADASVRDSLVALLKSETSATEYLNLWRAAHSKPFQETSPADSPDIGPVTPVLRDDLFGRKIPRVQF